MTVVRVVSRRTRHMNAVINMEEEPKPEGLLFDGEGEKPAEKEPELLFEKDRKKKEDVEDGV